MDPSEADQATAESLLGRPLSDIPEEPSDLDSSSAAESLSMWLSTHIQTYTSVLRKS